MREEVLYVVRLWRDTTDGDGWRASVEDLRRGTREVFPNLELLAEFMAAHKARNLGRSSPEAD